MRAIDAWIDAHLVYPESARRRGEQGAVVLRLTLAHDGRVLDADLRHGSGSDVLDDAALDLLRDARLPAAGPDDPPRLVIDKPIRFHLD
jgi:protein TonB